MNAGLEKVEREITNQREALEKLKCVRVCVCVCVSLEQYLRLEGIILHFLSHLLVKDEVA